MSDMWSFVCGNEEEQENEMIILDDEDESQPTEEAKPIDNVIGISGNTIVHYKAFEFKGTTYKLEDTVLIVPDKLTKPYVAIIKRITERKNGSIMLYVQWFYRPEDIENENAEGFQSSDSRELFYTFHQDEIPAESIFHKCVVHFVPPERRIPSYRENPGFIVQKVYNPISKRLFKLTDKNYEDNLRHEVDLLVQKTMRRLGDLHVVVESE